MLKEIFSPGSLLILHRPMFSFCFDWRSRAAKIFPVEVYNKISNSSGQVVE